ncbi:hypothetical protein ABL78_4727 [Leptomonas seymouri]|uniref:Uncharacterized protein n=1 Tax=Leptomonas seymouri TaxID=5684 RepID=A0A0N1I600_LEPSE|nr:hypothetical protein ABL78_4727 [Leptomonas seymouri]|eukprot:KPI86214.1 hypothetical protein ABL78_4727 [Leptomonas seymouri]
MSLHRNLPPRPCHIAASIHVIATRLSQNTADRITIGNTPLHILHLCDAQYLAPLFPSCHSLRAVTVHLQYVASSTALEVFLQGAARCSSLRDVSLIGGATPMEAAAIAAGLAAFTSDGRESAPFDQHAQQRCAPTLLPRTTRRLRGAWADHRFSDLPLYRSPKDAYPQQLFPSARARRRSREVLCESPSAFCPASPPGFKRGHPAHPPAGRGNALSQFSAETARGGWTTRSTHASFAAISPAFTPALQQSSEGVRVTLELHRVSDETSAVLLEGLRRGSRISSVAVRLRVSTADARLSGLRLAQRVKQVTQRHRRLQQRSVWQSTQTLDNACPIQRLSKGNGVPSDISRAERGTGRRPRVASGPPSPVLRLPFHVHRELRPAPPSPYGPHRAHNAGSRVPHTSSSSQPTRHPIRSPTQYGARAPAASSAATESVWRVFPPSAPFAPSHPPAGARIAPNTPPFARVPGAPAQRPLVNAGQVQGKMYEDAFRRRGRHFFSSERRSAVAGAYATPLSVINTPQPPRLRCDLMRGRVGATRQARTPISSSQIASSISDKAQPKPQQVIVSQRSARRSSSSSFSPIVLDPDGFRRGRSSSFSSWSSRSTSPQPRPPVLPLPQLPSSFAAARAAYDSLTRCERDSHSDAAAEGRCAWRECLQQCNEAAGQGPPQFRPSPYAPVSAWLCSPRYCVRRGRGDLLAAQQCEDSPHITAVTHCAPSRTPRHARYSSPEHQTPCACFVCATPRGKTEGTRPRSSDITAVAAHERLPTSPRTPTGLRHYTRESMLGAVVSAARSPQLQSSIPSPLSQLSAPPSSTSRSSPTGGAAAISCTPLHRALHKECQVSLQKARAESGSSDGVHTADASTPGITARTPEEQKRSKRPCIGAHLGFLSEAECEGRRSTGSGCPAEVLGSDGSSQGAATAAPGHRSSYRCVSRTQLPSPRDRLPSLPNDTTTLSGAAAESADEQSEGMSDSAGYVVYPNSLKFLRARVADINRHVVWHQVKAAKEAVEHSKRLAALGEVFAGRVTEQLSDILMVLTDMAHGSRSGRR